MHNLSYRQITWPTFQLSLQGLVMSFDIGNQISSAEERLRLAMLTSDHRALDELISSELVFTNHLGQVFGKQEDLALHRAGTLKFQLLEPSELEVKADTQLAVVSVRMAVSGSYDGSSFTEDLRYTRVWRSSPNGNWTIVAGHSSRVTK
jgi:ketosteroid isomerase-like protein